MEVLPTLKNLSNLKIEISPGHYLITTEEEWVKWLKLGEEVHEQTIQNFLKMSNIKIPTASEFLQNYIEENNYDSNIDIEDALIEFAKMHVQQA